MGSSGGHRGLSPIQSRKGHHQKEHLWASCTVLTEPPISLAVGASQIWQAAAPVSVTSISLGAEHWAVYQFYSCQLPLPENRSTFAIPGLGLYYLGPLRGVSHSLSPLPAAVPQPLPKLATIEVAVREPKRGGRGIVQNDISCDVCKTPAICWRLLRLPSQCRN